MTSAIVVAAGSSSRMGFDKLFADLHGKPVLLHALLAFERSTAIDEIVLVLNEAQRARVDALIGWARLKKVRRLVPGGAERHLSVARGLEAVDPSATVIAVHDGARPLVSDGDLLRTVQQAQATGAAVLAHPVVDTLKRSDDGRQVTGHVDRSQLWAMETPQAFRADWLREAYARVAQTGLAPTDEVSAMQELGHPVTLVAATAFNPKITHPADLELVKKLLVGGG